MLSKLMSSNSNIMYRENVGSTDMAWWIAKVELFLTFLPFNRFLK